MNMLRSLSPLGAGLVLLAGLALPSHALAVQVFSDPIGDTIGLGDGPDATALLAEDQGNTLHRESTPSAVAVPSLHPAALLLLFALLAIIGHQRLQRAPRQ